MSGWRAIPLLSRCLAGAFGFLLLTAPALAAPPATAHPAGTVAGLPEDKALALGERMYRQGLLPSGEPMPSVVNNDVPVAGTAFSCSSCHPPTFSCSSYDPPPTFNCSICRPLNFSCSSCERKQCLAVNQILL